MESNSQIVQFFAGKTVFLTGSTGFLGKLLLEKLLRVCHPKKIFLIVRCKKQQNETTRFQDMFDMPVFDPMKEACPDYMQKVQMIPGDCSLDNMGMSQEDLRMLIEETQIVLHCAATVRFDQALRAAYNINIRATRDLLKFAQQMTKLESFVHVSTAYSNCPRKDIDEICYKAPMTDSQLDEVLKAIPDDELIEKLTRPLLGEWPNTYSLTKCVCEEMVHRMGCENNLPVAIIRPSIVISTYQEPVSGWVDNFYGPVGVTYGVGLGLLRTLNCIAENHADMVPADYVVNGIFSTAWVTSLQNSLGDVQIYNFTAGRHAITWGRFSEEGILYSKIYVCSKCIWPVLFRYNRYEWKHKMDIFLLHTIPSYIVDFIAKLIGKEPLMVEGYKKIHKFIDAIQYFTMREWNFSTSKMESVWDKFNDEDKKLFEIRMKTFDWAKFMPLYLLGGRKYLVKDDPNNMPEAQKRYRRLLLAHWTLKTILYALAIYFFYAIYSLF